MSQTSTSRHLDTVKADDCGAESPYECRVIIYIPREFKVSSDGEHGVEIRTGTEQPPTRSKPRPAIGGMSWRNGEVRNCTLR